MPEKTAGKALPIPLRIALVAGIAIVALGGGLFGLWLTGAFSTGHKAVPAPAVVDGQPFDSFLLVVVLLVLGGIALVLGLATYFIVLATQCFIFDFRRPVLPRLKSNLFAANIIVPMALLGGVAAIVGAPVAAVLISVGVPPALAATGAVLGLFFLLQLVQIWTQIWAPLEKSIITKRLASYGATREQLAGAVLVGISDPSRSSLKKLTMVEDDIGAMWITPEVMAYRGDDDQFDIRPEQFLGIERKADTWSTSSLAGAVHVLVRFRTPEGTERTVRFHVQGGWTLTAKARAMDRLAEQIARWEEAAKARLLTPA